MKKIGFIFIMLSVASMHAAEPQKSYAAITKDKALKQFDKSYSRLKRCIDGKCSTKEAFQAARDISAAAVLAIGVIYGVSKGMYAASEALAYKIRKPPFDSGDRVQYQNYVGVVHTVNPFNQTVTIGIPLAKKNIIAPFSEVKIREKAQDIGLRN